MLKRIFLSAVVLISLMGTSACQISVEHIPDNSDLNKSPPNISEDQSNVKLNEDNIENKNSEEDNIVSDDSKNKTVTVYFGDSQALGLVREERTVQDVTPESAINEIIKGPKDPNNSRTIPEGTKLLGVEIKDRTAYVNFSKELKDNHWGGSAGETFTIYSIVNTLVLQPNLDIERVQILIEGETVETLAGHADISIPLEPNLEMVDMK